MASVISANSKGAHSVSATSFTIQFPQQPTHGNTLLCAIATSTNSRTFTAVDNVNGTYNVDYFVSPPGSYSLAVCTFPDCSGTGGAPTVTITVTGGACVMLVQIQEISGILTTAPFDQQATASNVGVTSGNCGTTGTLAQAAEYAVGWIIIGSDDTSLAISTTGWTADGASPVTTLSSGSAALGYFFSNATTALTPAFAWTTANSYRGITATYKVAGGTNLAGQTITSTEGTPGAQVSYSMPSQSITSSISSALQSPQLAVTLGAQTITSTEGVIVSGIPLLGQTITSTLGTITASTSSSTALVLGPITAQFTQGVMTLDISYILDQNTITIVGQTATFTQGVMSAVVSPAIGSLTLTSALTSTGIAPALATNLLGQTATFTEGMLSVQAGNNLNVNLGSQLIDSIMGVMTLGISYTMPAGALTATEGTITFSNTGNFTIQLGSLTATFTEGIISPPMGINEWVARESLMNAGLVPIVQYDEDPTVPPGNVISQSPPAGSIVAINSPVVMVVSRGPHLVPGQTLVPNLIGLYWKDATDALAANALSQDKYVWQVNAASEGSVVAQSVAAGAMVPVATLVQLTLSAGPARVPATVPVPVLH